MNDRIKELFRKAGERLDLVITGALVLLLIIAGYLFYREQDYTVPPPVDPQPKDFTVKLPIERVDEDLGQDNPEYLEAVRNVQLQFVETEREIQNDPEASILIRRNMFDLKSVREQEQAAEQLNQQYVQADRLYQRGEYEQAREIVNEILLQDPTHQQALELRERLDEAQQEAEEGNNG